jgi:hypothetical protein
MLRMEEDIEGCQRVRYATPMLLGAKEVKWWREEVMSR